MLLGCTTLYRDTTTTLSPSTSMDATSPTHHLSTTPPQTASTIHSIPRSQAYCLMLGVLQTTTRSSRRRKHCIAVTETHRYKTMVPMQSFCLQERQKLVRGRDYICFWFVTTSLQEGSTTSKPTVRVNSYMGGNKLPYTVA